MEGLNVTQRGDSASQRSADAIPNNLPAELTSFIGRAAELADVRELLREARLLTLVGAGGCGKTRLALQSASGALERFPDGIWWIELGPLEDPELLPTTIGSALGLRDRPYQTPLDVLREHLRDRRVLLVLDNCEHLLEACATLVDTLLHSCRGLVVLTTSRELLGIPGELRYRVPSLTLPADSDSLAGVTQSDAVRLFSERATHARPTFAVTAENATAVTAICNRLDGLPLAIELAAARVRMLSPERIAAELDDRFRLLTGSGPRVAPRHETLRASIDWSHALCSEQERVLLRRLSVWTGGFTLDGAEAVGADGALDRRAVLEPLTGLVDKYLVDTEERGGEIRFRMLETIRQYAAERLTQAGEVEATQARHLAWCLHLAERAEPELVRHDADKWLGTLEPEAANLRAALEWALVDDHEVALRLAAALTFFWVIRGRLEEGIAALARPLEVAAEPSATRGKALWSLAYLNIWRGQFGACLEHAERALEDGEATGDGSVMARALTARGLIDSVVNPVHGRPALERSVALAREAGDAWCAADAMRLLGTGYMLQSEHDAGRPIQEEGYELARELGYRPFYAWYFWSRATAELEQGRLFAARELAEQGAAISRELGEPVMLGGATALLIECDVLEGAPAEGRARAEPYLEVMRRSGARSAEPWIEYALALADVAEGAPAAARARMDAMLPLVDAAPAYNNVWHLRRTRAVVLLMLADPDGAETEAERLLSHAKSGRNEYVEAIAHQLFGGVAMARRAVIEAEGHLHRALAIAARRDFRLQTLSALESLARVAASTDSLAEAARLLGAVRAAREELGVVRWPPEPELRGQVEQELRLALGNDAFAAAETEGRTLSVEAAVEYASRARGKRKRPLGGWESLTPTEEKVVELAAQGLTNPQIAERMFISRSTVKAHLAHVFRKLDVRNRAELTAQAVERQR